MKKILFILSIVINFNILAQEKFIKNHVAVELDPAPFILKGYSISLKFSPKQIPNFAFMSSVFSSNFPDAMMSKANIDKGWKDLRFETSYALFIEYYPSKQRKGFLFGISTFLYNKSATLSSLNNRASFSTIYPNIRLSYIYYPFKKIKLYLNPWISVGAEIKIDNENILNGVSFSPNVFHYIIALHLGYGFNF